MQKPIKSQVMDTLLDDGSIAAPQALRDGKTVEGKMIAVAKNTLYVDLDASKIGVVYGKEYREAATAIKDLKPGDIVHARVVSLENEEGYVELSMKEASQERAWDALKRKMEEGEVIRAKILEVNRGGLIAEHEGVAGFMPVSQLSFTHYPRVEGGDKQKIFQELQKFLGQELSAKIIAVDQNENKLIFSEKAAENKELKDLLATYKVGDVVEGTVSGVVHFGAFVKFSDNLEGLVHISELDWQLIEDPHDVVRVGDAVRAEIIGIGDDRVSLSLKRLKPNPWDSVGEKYHAGDAVCARIMKLNPFGAFARLDKDIHGLAHISEFGSEEKMQEELKVGEEYEFTILAIEPKEYKMALGFKKRRTREKAEATDATALSPEVVTEEKTPGAAATPATHIEDLNPRLSAPEADAAPAPH